MTTDAFNNPRASPTSGSVFMQGDVFLYHNHSLGEGSTISTWADCSPPHPVLSASCSSAPKTVVFYEVGRSIWLGHKRLQAFSPPNPVALLILVLGKLPSGAGHDSFVWDSLPRELVFESPRRGCCCFVMKADFTAFMCGGLQDRVRISPTNAN
jgi:hypothetical protein